MLFSTPSINQESLDACVGKKVKPRADKGRKRVLEAEGVLVETYPKLFVIKLDKSNAVRRLSYTYADILTEKVEALDDKLESQVNSLSYSKSTLKRVLFVFKMDSEFQYQYGF